MSKYAKSIIHGDEKIVYIAKPHWITFLSLSGFLTLFIVPWIYYKTTEFVVTNKRFIYKTGLIRREAHDINFNSTEMINLMQGLWGRVLNYGDITIMGNGGRGQEYKTLADPIAFRKACPF